MSSLRHIIERTDRIVDRVIPSPTGITVLIYHRVGGGSDSAVDITAEAFEQQLEYLVANHRVLSLDDAVTEIAAARPSGWSTSPDADPADAEPGIVITFDDGTADFVDVAAPLLERHGVPAALYVATQFVDEQQAFPWGAPPATWSGLADATRSGLITVESHSHSHPLFSRLDRQAAATELDRSIELIGEHMGSAPRHFAYPKAVPASPAAEVEVRRRFSSAVLARNRVNVPARTDPFRIWRTPIRRTDDLDSFARRSCGGYRLEGEIRSVSAPLRYRRSAT